MSTSSRTGFIIIYPGCAEVDSWLYEHVNLLCVTSQ